MKSYIRYIFYLGVIVSFIGCGSTGPDHGDPPSLPKLQNIQAKPDFSYFQNNQPKLAGNTISADTTNYYAARNSVLTYTSFFSSMSFYSGFFSEANQQDASYNDGVWEWKYSYSYESQSVEIRLTAKQVSDGYQWTMYWSSNTSSGMNFNDYKVLQGTISKDGSQGSWTFYSLSESNEPIPALKSTWTVTSDTQKTMTMKIYDGSGNLSFTMNFKQDGADNTLASQSSGSGGGSFTIYWNTDTQTGYVIQQDSPKQCWNSSFVNTPCS